MSIDVPAGHPLYSFGDKVSANHKRTVEEFENMGLHQPLDTLKTGEKPLKDKELQALWDKLKDRTLRNSNLLSHGAGKGGNPRIGATHDIFMIHMRVDIYNLYYDKVNPENGKKLEGADRVKALREATAQVLEREEIRYQYAQAIRASKAYRDMPDKTQKDQDAREAYLTKRLMETYTLVPNGWMSISHYGKTKDVKELLKKQLDQNAKEVSEKQPPETKPDKKSPNTAIDDNMMQALLQFFNGTLMASGGTAAALPRKAAARGRDDDFGIV